MWEDLSLSCGVDQTAALRVGTQGNVTKRGREKEVKHSPAPSSREVQKRVKLDSLHDSGPNISQTLFLLTKLGTKLSLVESSLRDVLK